MLSLQRRGCHNINLVTPTHVSPQIVQALVIAAQKGLSIPIVYNCGGYESVKTLRLLVGIVDIYMPDIKYSDNENARKYSGAKDYWNVVRPAVQEMQRQVGCLQTNDDGIATRGLIIRHLVLPNNIAGSRRVLSFIAKEVSVDSYVNIMDQYRPMYRAGRYPELARQPYSSEYSEIVEFAESLGLHRGF
jgi:putative pyruvate formate lyase activating enzyme